MVEQEPSRVGGHPSDGATLLVSSTTRRSLPPQSSPGGSKIGGILCEDYAEIVDEEVADYSSPTRDYEVDRSKVELQEIIGEGQFGDVHKGIYRPDGVDAKDHHHHHQPRPVGGATLPVAVKICKVVDDDVKTEKFLEEACEYTDELKGFLCEMSGPDSGFRGNVV